jgi:hypothetical protein
MAIQPFEPSGARWVSADFSPNLLPEGCWLTPHLADNISTSTNPRPPSSRSAGLRERNGRVEWSLTATKTPGSRMANSTIRSVPAWRTPLVTSSLAIRTASAHKAVDAKAAHCSVTQIRATATEAGVGGIRSDPKASAPGGGNSLAADPHALVIPRHAPVTHPGLLSLLDELAADGVEVISGS